MLRRQSRGWRKCSGRCVKTSSANWSSSTGGANHVQLLVNFPPKVALSGLVNSLKGVSSRRMHQEFPELARHYWRDKQLWSRSYFAGSVGKAPIEVVCQYIEQQERPA